MRRLWRPVAAAWLLMSLLAPALATAQSTPGPPTNVTVVRGNGSLSVSWTAPEGFASAVYNVRYSGPGRSETTAATGLSATSLQITTAYGATVHNGESFIVGVQAVDSSDSTLTSRWIEVVVDPIAPATLGAISTARDSSIVHVTWPNPAADAAGNYPSGFEVLTRPIGTSDWTVSSTQNASARTARVTGLEPCVSYDARVRPYNTYTGVGPSATTVTTTALSPKRTTGQEPLCTPGLHVTRGDGTLNVSWSGTRDVSCQGNPLTGYVLEYHRVGRNGWPRAHTQPDKSAISHVISHIDNSAAYRVRIRPIYGAQSGSYTTSRPVQPLLTLPSRVSMGNITRDLANNTVSFTFTPPQNAGSNPSYDITFSTSDPNVGPRQWDRAVDDKTVAQHTGLTQSGNTVTFTTTTACAYDYYVFGVRARNSTGAGSWRNSPTISPGPGAHPAAPSVTATGGVNQVMLAWTPGNANTVSKWQYQQKTGNAAWSAWTDIPNSGPGQANARGYTVTGLDDGARYQFRVRGHHAHCKGASSQTSQATTTMQSPGNVSVSRGDGSLSVSWTTSGISNSVYNVRYQATDRSVTTAATAQSATSLQITTAYGAAVHNGESFTVGVQAVDSSDSTITSAWVEVEVPAMAPVPLGAVSTARANGTTWVTWPDPGPDAAGAYPSGFEILTRPAGTGDWKVSSTQGASTRSAALTGLDACIAYDVRVRSYNTYTSVGPSAGTVTTTALSPKRTTGQEPLFTPGLHVTRGDGTLNVSWSGTRDTSCQGYARTGYVLEFHRVGRSGWPRAHTQPDKSATSHVINHINNDAAYRVRIRPIFGAQSGSYTTSPTIQPLVGIPSRVSMGNITRDTANNTVSFTFTPPADAGNSPSYDITFSTSDPNVGPRQWDRAVDDKTVAQHTGLTQSGSTVTFTTTTACAYDYYVFGIRVRNSAGASGWNNSPTISPGPGAHPAAPSLTATLGTGQADLAWTPGNANTVEKWQYQQKTGSAAWGAWTDIPDSGPGEANASSYGVTGLTAGTSHQFRVRGYKSYCRGAASQAASVTVPSAVPGAVSFSLVPLHQSVRVTWTEPDTGGSPITKYRISIAKSDDLVASGKSLDAAASTRSVTLTSTATESALANGTYYSVWVEAYNLAGRGALASLSSVQPTTTPPDAPAAPTMSTQSRQMTATWTAPSYTGGSAITDYDVRYRASGTTAWTDIGHTGTGTSATITGLVDGTAYQVQVRAVNSVTPSGNSAWSAAATATPTGPPYRPDQPGLTRGNRSLTVRWTAPADGGSPLTEYRIAYRAGSSGPWTITEQDAPSTSATITGLQNGTAYQVRIRAHSLLGNSVWSRHNAMRPSSVAPAVISEYKPSVIESPTRNDASIDAISALGYVANGATPTAFQLRYCTGSGLDCDSNGFTTLPSVTRQGTQYLQNLTLGFTYYVQGRARNSVGWSPWAFSASAIQANSAHPSAPASLTVTPGDRTLTANWTAPANLGTSATLREYEYRWRAAGTAEWPNSERGSTTATTVTISNLTNGVDYEFGVQAENSNDKDSALRTVFVTPRAKPAEPAVPTLTAGHAHLDVHWDEPENNGEPITAYEIDYRVGASGDWSRWPYDTEGADTHETIEGLSNGTAYSVRVRARNVVGVSDWSPIAVASPTGPPGRPTIRRLESWASFPLQVYIRSAVQARSTLTHYLIQYRTVGSTSWTTQKYTPATPTGEYQQPTLTNVAAGTYEVRIRSVNSAGNSVWSAVQTITVSGNDPAAPSAPSISGTANNEAAYIAWPIPADNGAGIITYSLHYISASGNDVADCGASWISVSSATPGYYFPLPGVNGTYYCFRVKATNNVGDSAFSNTIIVSPTGNHPDATHVSSVTSGDGSLTVAWTKPSSFGSGTFSAYFVRHRELGTASWTSNPISSEDTTSYTITGLDNGTEYEVAVHALNSNSLSGGAQTGSSLMTGMPRAKPDVVSHAVEARHHKVNVSWSEPDNNGAPILEYTVEYCKGTSNACSLSTATWTIADHEGHSLNLTIPHLINDTEYQVRVKAENSLGTSTSSLVSATPTTSIADAPGTPTLLVGSDRLGASWSAPADNGGSTISGYKVQYKLSSASTWSNATRSGPDNVVTSVFPAASATISGLTKGSAYDVRVRAVNSKGDGDWSDAATATTADTEPWPPDAPTLTAGNQRIAVAWQAPSHNGGKAVSDYDVEYRTVSADNWTSFAHTGTTRSATITGLTNGTTYLVRVRAVNEEGNGIWSEPSSATTTATAPGSVRNLAVTLRHQTLRLDWDAPSDDGGSTITGYDVAYKLSTSSTWTDFTHSGTGTQADITGLTNSSSYNVRVRAANSIGAGAWSSFATPVSPTTTKPDPLERPLVTRGNASLSVSWQAPSYIGAGDIHSYKLRYKKTSDATWSQQSLGSSTSTTLTNLVNDTSYDLQVAARNTAVTTFSDWSATTMATPSTVAATPPTTPELVTLTPFNGKMKASWYLEADGGASITNYVLEYRQGSTGDFTEASKPKGNVTSAVVDGLTNNTSYQFRVRASNSIGHSLWSTIESQTPLATPPTDATLATLRPHAAGEAGNGSVILEGLVQASSQLRMLVSHIQMRLVDVGSLPGGTSCLTVASGNSAIAYDKKLRAIDRHMTLQIDSLANDKTYQWCGWAFTELPSESDPTVFRAGGTSFLPVSFTPKSTAPSFPTNVQATPGDGSLSISWSAPTNNGGSTLKSYLIKQGTRVSGNKATVEYGTAAVVTSPHSATSLTNGRKYYYYLYARNQTSVTAYSIIAVPAGKPATPTLTLSKGNSEVCASWNEPNANGSPISKYTIRYRGANLNQNWTQKVFNGTVNQNRITGLATGYSYEYQIKASNAQGDSAWSASSTIRANGASTCTFS